MGTIFGPVIDPAEVICCYIVGWSQPTRETGDCPMDLASGYNKGLFKKVDFNYSVFLYSKKGK